MGGPSTAASTGPDCLSDRDIATLRDAPPGTLPEAVARHLAGCPRCQQRALFGTEARRPGRKREVPELPSLGRALLLVLIVLAAFGGLLYSLHRLWPR
jgi:hypothetical protein